MLRAHLVWMHLSIAQLREIAAQANIDPRTLGKVVRGEPVRGMAGERAREALKAAGIKAEANAAPKAAGVKTAAWGGE